MKKLFLISCSLLIVGFSAQAMQPAVIGGIRDGLAVGIMADEPLARNVGIRFGIEANTGHNPILVFFGGKFYLTSMNRMPLSLGVGAIAYTGDKDTDVGASISLIFDRAFNIAPLFAEVGVDIADSGRLQAQLGYQIR
jgi:hypothetical protein